MNKIPEQLIIPPLTNKTDQSKQEYSKDVFYSVQI